MYVARTLSDNPDLTKLEHLHKIGYTGNRAEQRVAGAENDPTFLNEPAALVATFEMPAEYAKLMENVLHQFFSEVRLDVWFDDSTSPREWFDVPMTAIEEAIELVQTGQLGNYRYNPVNLAIELA